MSSIRTIHIIAVVACAALCVVDGAAAQERTARWAGTITMTETFTGTVRGEQVTARRIEQWKDFVVTSGDEGTAFFATTWTVDLVAKEVGERCTTTREARGSAAYGSLSFDLNPLDEKSYRIYSSGTGEVPQVTGTMTQACRDEAATLPFDVLASWLPPAPFVVPADLLPPDLAAKQLEQPVPPTAVAGTLDPQQPHILRGHVTHRAESGAVVTVSWNLSRSPDCGDESPTQDLVRRETARLRAHEAVSREAPSGSGGGEPPALSASTAPVVSNAALTAQTVAAAVRGAAGGPDQVVVRDASGTDTAGTRRFGLRLSSDGRALPSLASIQREIDRACVPPGLYEGAPRLLLGAIQWNGAAFRITARVVETETGVVQQTAGNTGRGGSAELQKALDGLFRQLATR